MFPGEKCEDIRILPNRWSGEMTGGELQECMPLFDQTHFREEGSCTCSIHEILPCKIWINVASGVSEKITFQHKNYAAMCGKFKRRVYFKTTKTNKTFNNKKSNTDREQSLRMVLDRQMNYPVLANFLTEADFFKCQNL